MTHPRCHTAVGKARHPAACLAAALAFSIALAACGRQSPIGNDVAVRIEEDEVPYGLFEAYLRKNVDRSEPALEERALSQLFDRFLDQLLLFRLARERGMTGRDADLDEAVGYLLDRSAPHSWSERELRSHYEAHRKRFQRPEEVLLRQILVQDRPRAEQAQRALQNGEDFAQVAARFSEEPRAKHGGDQGRLARENLPSEFSDVIFELEPGETTDIVSAGYGYHIFQVLERYPAAVEPFEAVVDEIRRQLEREQLDQRLRRLTEEARASYDVEVFLFNLPFAYRGFYATNDDPARAE